MSDQLVLQNETTTAVINRVNADYWKDKNILITGITGFVGSWLTEILSSSQINANIYGLLRRQSNPNLRNIQHLLDRENIKLIKGDLQDLGSIVNAIKESDADVIYHLAAQSFVPHSFASPIDTYSTNVTGTLNMLEALRLTPGNVALHYAGSSEEYGLVLQNNQHYKTMLDKYKTILPSPNLDSNNNVVNEAPIKEPNPLREKVISFPSTLPKEFNLHKFVNYDEQFDKSFLEPLIFIVNAINWNFEKQATLDGFF